MSNETELTSEDYAYRLPDHWLLPEDSIWTQMHHAYVGRVVELVKASQARRVLELGCGDGWNCGKLAEAGLDVVGVDWSHNAIEHARRMVPKGRFICGDVRDPAIAAQIDGPFDAVVFIEVIEHIPPRDCRDALDLIARQLKPGGTLVLTTPSVNFPNDNPQHYRHFDEATLRDLIDARSGFRIEHIEGYGDVPAADRYHRVARWIDNRYWVIKPARRWLQARYRRQIGKPTQQQRCHGFIVVAHRLERVATD